LAVAISTGGKAFGNLEVEEGDVLYLALEDNERRLKKRLDKLCPSMVPPRLDVAFECPPIDKGGIKAIREWVAEKDNPRLIIVDVFSRVRVKTLENETLYQSDYRALQPLKALADQKGLAIIVVHHTRKMRADDLFDMVSGSTGFTGAADTTLVLSKDSQGVTLYGRGRDIEEIDTAMYFDKETCMWRLLGAASEVRRSDQRTLILDVLAEATEAMFPRTIATATGLPDVSVRQLLLKMARGSHQARSRQVPPSRSNGPPTRPDGQ
jgi:hypothetical protein